MVNSELFFGFDDSRSQRLAGIRRSRARRMGAPAAFLGDGRQHWRRRYDSPPDLPARDEDSRGTGSSA
jgi:hypothetical protein